LTPTEKSNRDHLEEIFNSLEDFIANSSNNELIVSECEQVMDKKRINFQGRNKMIRSYILKKSMSIQEIRKNKIDKVLIYILLNIVI